jgi:hypothetical protein
MKAVFRRSVGAVHGAESGRQVEGLGSQPLCPGEAHTDYGVLLRRGLHRAPQGAAGFGNHDALGTPWVDFRSSVLELLVHNPIVCFWKPGAILFPTNCLPYLYITEKQKGQ